MYIENRINMRYLQYQASRGTWTVTKGTQGIYQRNNIPFYGSYTKAKLRNWPWVTVEPKTKKVTPL
ncbi:predicted protein [Botrytis cinerea T4]|uniref:Uncharacterized protein n=1 Tax=Botryotinia fuckeliana (strain T4) TaxID=999810 RepID=G2Y422_BOTF4|nr:predicted protein [Botrytis cinerea T4]